MVAVLQVSVSYGAGPTNSDGVSGIDLISADNATNSPANRSTYPITVGTNSYEKWVRLKIQTAPDNYVRSFKVWGDGGVMTSTTLYFTGAYATYSEGTTATSAIANADFTSYTAGAPATWDDAEYSLTDSYTAYTVWQLAVGSDANPGNWTQETINYSYQEA